MRGEECLEKDHSPVLESNILNLNRPFGQEEHV